MPAGSPSLLARVTTIRPSSSSSKRTSVPGGHSAAMWPGRCSTPSSPTTAYSEPPWPSAPTRPPFIVTVRGKVAATSGWWVTTTIVVPKSSPREWIRCSTWSRSAWLSWLVGSSASSSRGAVETAQARARRWRWPPDIVETTWSAWSTRPTRSSSSTSASAPVAVAAGEREPGEGDVLPGGGVGQQVAGGALEHRGDLARADPGEVALTHPRHLLLAEEDPARAGALDAAEQRQQRRLARAAGAEEGHALAGADGEVDAAQGDDVVPAEGLVEVDDALAPDAEASRAGLLDRGRALPHVSPISAEQPVQDTQTVVR